jgi:hypothetical protein
MRARAHTHTAGEELESSVLQQSGHVLPEARDVGESCGQRRPGAST